MPDRPLPALFRADPEPAGWADVMAAAHPGMPGARPDKLRAAREFIDRHGRDAEERAVTIAAAWMEAGNQAVATWLVEVAELIREFDRTQRYPGERTH